MNKTEADAIFATLGGRQVLGNGGIAPDSTVIPEPLQSLSSQYWINGYFYSFAQRNKHQYQSFTDVENDANLVTKFQKFIDDQDSEILLPGEKEFKTVTKKVAELDSSKSEINDALALISDFYADQENEKRASESDDIHKFLLLEFSGLIDGIEGRLLQSLKDDNTVKTALDILSDKLVYESSLLPSQITEN